MPGPYDDCSCFNVRDDSGQYLCPVCGLSGYFNGSSFGEQGTYIATGICPCCCYEPGFDDNPLASAQALPTVEASIRDYRSKWMRGGMQWQRDPTRHPRPAGWNAQDCLRRLFELAPFLQ